MHEPTINFLHEEQIVQELPKKSQKIKKFFAVFFALFVVMIGSGFVISKYALDRDPADPFTYDPVTLDPKSPEGFFKRLGYFVFSKEAPLKGETVDRINLLILGQGGPGHDGPYLTDTIMIVSIKPSTNQIAMISIPRDLGVNIPGHGSYKINHANHFGEKDQANWGAAFATEVIEKTFALDISYYVRIDFSAFEEIIDEVDGVSVNVDKSFTDYEYPAANDKYQVVSFKKGVQTMNGKTALMYARSRHGNNGEGSDFARAARQQKILLALKEKLLSFQTLANPVKINNIIESLDSHITTNMEFPEIMAHLKLAKSLDTDQIITLVLDNSTDGYLQNGRSSEGAYILEPKTGNFDQINYVIEHIFEEIAEAPDTTPSQVEPLIDNAVIEVQNGTWRAGLAARVKKSLELEKLEVPHIGNAITRPQVKSGIYNISNAPQNADIIQKLQQTLALPILQNPPEGITTESDTDVLIILGENYNEE